MGIIKKILSVILCLSFIISTIVFAFAEMPGTIDSGTCGTNTIWTLYDNGNLTLSGNGEVTNSNSYSGYPWYVHKNEITSVTISEGVTNIPNSAFYNYTSLTGGLVFPTSLTVIGNKAFYGCKGLNGMVLFNNGLQIINEGAFQNCIALTGDLIFPATLSSIGEHAFYGCSGLNGRLSIPEGVTEIGQYAFDSCSRLVGDLILPDSLIKISTNAFANCVKLNGILRLGNSVISIGANAFYKCSQLSGDLIIPNSVTTIGKSAFYGNAGFSGSLQLSSALTSINEAAFAECRNLQGNIMLPTSLKTIGKNAFINDEKLSGDLVFYDNVTSIGEAAFKNCTGLNGQLILGKNITRIDKNAFDGCSNLTGDIILPSGLTTISPYTFNQCKNLTGDLIIPSGVSTIGVGAFQRCGGFDGVLAIPDTVKTIGKEAFHYCQKLSGKLVIPESVTTIGQCAFHNCGADIISFFEDYDSYIKTVVEENEQTGKVYTAVYCSDCNATVRNLEDLSHQLVKVDRVEATPISDGNIEFYTCDSCDKLFADSSAKTELMQKDTILHYWSEPYYDSIDVYPTCTKTGIGDRAIACVNCGIEFTREEDCVIPVLDHTEGMATEEDIISATCNKNGSYNLVVRCLRCNKILSSESKVIQCIGHTPDYVMRVDATYGKDGHDAYYKCIECEKLFSTVECKNEINYEDIILHYADDPVQENAAAINENGIGTFELAVYCVNCGKELERTTVTVTEIKEKAPTPTEDGNICYYAGDDNTNYVFECGKYVPVDDVSLKYVFVLEADDIIVELGKSKNVNARISAKPYNVIFDYSSADSDIVSVDTTGNVTAKAIGRTDVTVCAEGLTKTVSVIVCDAQINIPAEIDEFSSAEVDMIMYPDDLSVLDITITSSDDNVISVGDNRKIIAAASGNADITVSILVTNRESGTIIEKVIPLTVKHIHTPGEVVKENIVEAECDTNGQYEEVIRCTKCNEILSSETKIIPASGHKRSDKQIENMIMVFCLTDGSYDEVVRCEICKQILESNTVIVKAEGHQWNDGDVFIEPTESSEGTLLFTCTECGETYSEDISYCELHGHTSAEAVKENIVSEVSCITNGEYDSVIYCSVCKEELSRESVFEKAFGHTPAEAIIENNIEADCEIDGSFDYVVCCVTCGAELERENIIIPAFGHAPGTKHKENTVNSTCVDDGSYDEVIRCETCGKILESDTVVIKTEGHKWNDGEILTVPTESIEGTVVYTCSECGETYSEDISYCELHGHTSAEAIIENNIAADCEIDGEYERNIYCVGCGELLCSEKIKLPAFGHKESNIEKTVIANPTCSDDGSHREVIICTDCNKVLSDKTVTDPATGHDWQLIKTNDDGSMEYSCKNCGEKKTVERDCKRDGHLDNNDDGYCDCCNAEIRFHCKRCDWYQQNKNCTGIKKLIVEMIHSITHMAQHINWLT